ncbi:hypothetical protein SERLA73DRAFT_191486 [Serpula lacrymans var. lacrymans S7.3]|uniref:Uncharacterized protein n=1 Tax=Serpula lacrymans var. lacrymans (strain S7.3) TaxID=936435 RepID=F8QHP3_SERL3|nr:hypothetical protein SERLA73DRAFT_191486 [Serpula lacrymans var. lacrymans S7.3]
MGLVGCGETLADDCAERYEPMKVGRVLGPDRAATGNGDDCEKVFTILGLVWVGEIKE